jgi:hypothetical protein
MDDDDTILTKTRHTYQRACFGQPASTAHDKLEHKPPVEQILPPRLSTRASLPSVTNLDLERDLKKCDQAVATGDSARDQRAQFGFGTEHLKRDIGIVATQTAHG